MSHLILFPPDGGPRFIHSDECASVAKSIGTLTIRRASHVEPTVDGRWCADMNPVTAGVSLGPYDTRAEALKAERDWLEMHDLPMPQ